MTQNPLRLVQAREDQVALAAAAAAHASGYGALLDAFDELVGEEGESFRMADILRGQEEHGSLVIAEEESRVLSFCRLLRCLIDQVVKVPKRHHGFRSRQPPMPKLDLHLLRLQALLYVAEYFRSSQEEACMSAALSGRGFVNDLSVDCEVELD